MPLWVINGSLRLLYLPPKTTNGSQILFCELLGNAIGP
jgi:hypothetical protein